MTGTERPPRVTAGIACFDAAATIARALESACGQAWPDLEVLVVDDCSTDGSPQRVERQARGDERVRLVRRDSNGGPGATRQTILDEATGEFVAFFDDDDVSEPGRIATQYRRIVDRERETGHRQIACYASGRREYPNGHVVDLPAIGSRPRVPHGTAVADYLLFGRRQPGMYFGAGTPTCALMARTEVLQRAGGFDPAFRRVEDADLAVRLAMLGADFIGCPEHLFRQYATFAGDKSADRNLEAELALVDKHREYLEQQGRYDYARRWFEVRHRHLCRDWPGLARAIASAWIRHPILTTSQVLRAGPRRVMHERRAGLRTAGER